MIKNGRKSLDAGIKNPLNVVVRGRNTLMGYSTYAEGFLYLPIYLTVWILLSIC